MEIHMYLLELFPLYSSQSFIFGKTRVVSRSNDYPVEMKDFFGARVCGKKLIWSFACICWSCFRCTPASRSFSEKHVWLVVRTTFSGAGVCGKKLEVSYMEFCMYFSVKNPLYSSQSFIFGSQSFILEMKDYLGCWSRLENVVASYMEVYMYVPSIFPSYSVVLQLVFLFGFLD